jgi:hypothetical protein
MTAQELERTDSFVDGLHAAPGEKPEGRSRDSSPKRIGSARQRAADGFSVPRTG